MAEEVAKGEVVNEELEKQRADRFHKLTTEIVRASDAARTLMSYLAPRLLEVDEQRLWAGEYDSFNQYLANPEIGITHGHARTIMRVYRAYVEQRKVPLELLEGVDLVRLDVARKALASGDADVATIVADAKTNTRQDMRRLYAKGGRDDPVDADDEPEFVRCPGCGRTVKEDQLRDGMEPLDD